MLTPHPVMLKNLIEQHEALRVLHARDGSVETRGRMNDSAYTLCVTTGTRDIDTALIIAHRQLAGVSGQADQADRTERA